jgi:hypothetical protein
MANDLSFEPILEMVDYIASYTKAVQTASIKFLAFLPIHFKQTISNLAKERLDQSRNSFLAGIQIDIQDDLLIVSVNPNDWLAVHVEAGADGFSMLKTHLSGPKTKVSKAGFKYKVIPLRVWKSTPSAKTDKGMEFYDILQKVLKNPKYGAKNVTIDPSGMPTVKEEVVSKIPEAQGMYRVQKYGSIADMVGKKKPKHSQLVLFRTISEKSPEKWQHPGIKPANILQDSLKIVETGIMERFDTFIAAELSQKGFT